MPKELKQMRIINKYLHNDDFDFVLENLEDTDAGIELLGLIYSQDDFSLSVYADKKDNYELKIDEYVIQRGGAWITLELTHKQKAKLEDALDQQYNKLLDDYQEHTTHDIDIFDVPFNRLLTIRPSEARCYYEG